MSAFGWRQEEFGLDDRLLTADELRTAQELIDRAEPRITSLKSLYARAWNTTTSPTEFGMRFKASVEAGQLRGVTVAGKSSDNAQLYVIKGGA